MQQHEHEPACKLRMFASDGNCGYLTDELELDARRIKDGGEALVPLHVEHVPFDPLSCHRHTWISVRNTD